MGISDVGDQLEGLDLAEQIMNEPRGTSLQRYSDKAMFEAKPMVSVEPKVYLLWMTPDPLGAIAAATKMYRGEPVYSLGDVTDQERRECWEINGKTALNAPLETVKLHFMIEGVDRAFTHQLVRQRTAVYFQESMRFAVKENLKNEVPAPPSFYDARVASNPSAKNDLQDLWTTALSAVDRAYKALIAAGVPAEDARGLLPTATLTRIQYCTDLRNLLEHAGNRLCTQAQFHWRSVFTQMRECIRNYPALDRGWQFETIADGAFVPKCYQQGRCTFNSQIDRGCTIRGRVDEFATQGVPSTEWEKEDNLELHGIYPIDRSEWALDPQAGWVR
jgi:thymidylate synthase (FAD)